LIAVEICRDDRRGYSKARDVSTLRLYLYADSYSAGYCGALASAWLIAILMLMGMQYSAASFSLMRSRYIDDIAYQSRFIACIRSMLHFNPRPYACA